MKTLSLKEVIALKKKGAEILDENGNPWKEPSIQNAMTELIGMLEQLVKKPVPVPTVNVPAPNITVSVPKADPPKVVVEAPNITVLPAPVETASKWLFTVIRDFRNGLIETVKAERIE